MGTTSISSVSVQTWSGWRLGLNQDRGFSGRAGWREEWKRVMSVCRTIMYHDGEVISAYYFAASNGKTSVSEEYFNVLILFSNNVTPDI